MAYGIQGNIKQFHNNHEDYLIIWENGFRIQDGRSIIKM